MNSLSPSTPKPASRSLTGSRARSGGKIEMVTQNLRERVQANEWRGEQGLPSQSQLSREYGVSPATIALAIRSLQKSGLVHIVPGRGAFVAESAGVAAHQNRTFPTLGLRGSYVNRLPAVLNEATSYTGVLVQMVWKAAHGEHCPLLLLPGLPGKDRLSRAYCQSRGVEGVIFLGGESYEEAMELRLSGFPVIVANEPSEPTSINYVNYDHAAALRDIVQRFATLGHRRIAVIAPGTSMPGSYQKLKPDFIDVLCSLGMLYDVTPYWKSLPRIIPDDSGRFPLVEETVNELLSLPEPPTAIFCWSQDASVEVLRVLAERGLRLPEDISLATFPLLQDLREDVSGYGVRHDLLATELVRGICETIRNPFFHLQKLLKLEFIDRGSLDVAPCVKNSQR